MISYILVIVWLAFNQFLSSSIWQLLVNASMYETQGCVRHNRTEKKNKQDPSEDGSCCDGGVMVRVLQSLTTNPNLSDPFAAYSFFCWFASLPLQSKHHIKEMKNNIEIIIIISHIHVSKTKKRNWKTSLSISVTFVLVFLLHKNIKQIIFNIITIQ
jgi:hypothetical protein